MSTQEQNIKAVLEAVIVHQAAQLRDKDVEIAQARNLADQLRGVAQEQQALAQARADELDKLNARLMLADAEKQPSPSPAPAGEVISEGRTPD